MLRYRLLVAVIGLPIGLAAVILGGYFLLGLAAARSPSSACTSTTPCSGRTGRTCWSGFVAGLGVVVGAYFFGARRGCWSGLAALMILTFFWSLGGELGAHLVGRMA